MSDEAYVGDGVTVQEGTTKDSFYGEDFDATGALTASKIDMLSKVGLFIEQDPVDRNSIQFRLYLGNPFRWNKSIRSYRIRDY